MQRLLLDALSERQIVGYKPYFKWTNSQYYTFCVTVPAHTLKERNKQTKKESKHSYNFITLYSPAVTICTASLTLTNSTFCQHSVLPCFVWISEQTAISPLYNINWLVVITEPECVYCAVRTGTSDSFQVPRNIQYTAYSIQYTVYCIQHTVYSIQYTVYCTLYTRVIVKKL